jgi:hypothetical protein
MVVSLDRAQIGNVGEQSAVRPKSGQSVSQSDPGLRRPTPPSTAGRKPAARPPFQIFEVEAAEKPHAREAGIAQPKIGWGAGRNPAVSGQCEALGISLPSSEAQASPLPAFDKSQIRTLVEFIKILDRWDREAHGRPTM